MSKLTDTHTHADVYTDAVQVHRIVQILTNRNAYTHTETHTHSHTHMHSKLQQAHTREHDGQTHGLLRAQQIFIFTVLRLSALSLLSSGTDAHRRSCQAAAIPDVYWLSAATPRSQMPCLSGRPSHGPAGGCDEWLPAIVTVTQS